MPMHSSRPPTEPVIAPELVFATLRAMFFPACRRLVPGLLLLLLCASDVRGARARTAARWQQ